MSETTTIEHSKTADALYIHLHDAPITRTEEVSPGHVMVDRDADNIVVGIEILLATDTRVEFKPADQGAA